jgi:hypothetical protein
MTIKVTRWHILLGKFYNKYTNQSRCSTCPITQAVKAKTKEKEVLSSRLGVSFGKEAKCIKLPTIALQFMSDADKGKKVKPFEFELEGI